MGPNSSKFACIFDEMRQRDKRPQQEILEAFYNLNFWWISSRTANIFIKFRLLHITKEPQEQETEVQEPEVQSVKGLQLWLASLYLL